MSMQYTIRSAPEAIDRAVRHRARREAKSANAVVVDALARGLELDARPAEHTDQNHLIGTWQQDSVFASGRPSQGIPFIRSASA